MRKKAVSLLMIFSMIITGTLSAYADEVPVLDLEEQIAIEEVADEMAEDGAETKDAENEVNPDLVELEDAEAELELLEVDDEILDYDLEVNMALGYDERYENFPIESVEIMPNGGGEQLLGENEAIKYSYYNPVDNISIPAGAPMIELQAVRNQNPYGTCWSHAAIFLSELAMRKAGLADKSVDLSELQLAYFLRFLPEDPLGNSTDTSNHSFAEDVKRYKNNTLTYDQNNGLSFLNRGGNTAYGGRVLANWIGAASESTGGLEYSNAEYRRLNGYTAEEVEKFARNADVGHLSAIYDLNAEDDPQYIKQMIYEYGGVSCSYFDGKGETKAEPYNSTNNCYMSEVKDKTNHAIAIVGWDDTFSREKFGNFRPQNDGAWLVRNSWGASASNHNEGYVWMSYDDKSIETTMVSVDAIKSDTYMVKV